MFRYDVYQQRLVWNYGRLLETDSTCIDYFADINVLSSIQGGDFSKRDGKNIHLA